MISAKEAFLSKTHPSHSTDVWCAQADNKFVRHPCFGVFTGTGTYKHVKVHDLSHDFFPASQYCMDLHDNFQQIPGNPPIRLVDDWLFIDIDCTKISGPVLLGMLNYYRVIAENPNIPIVYSMLKEEVPELNFYQRLIASHLISRPNIDRDMPHFWGIHGGFIYTPFNHINKLSLENLIEWWKNNRPSLSIAFSSHKSFQYTDVDAVDLLPYAAGIANYNNPPMWAANNYGRQSQYLWLPEPWRRPLVHPMPVGPTVIPGGGLPMTDKAIKYLLDPKLTKQWVTYA